MDTEQKITSAADQLTDTIAVHLGDLAAEILDLPESGSAEWVERQQYFRENPKAAEQASRDWQLTKLAIARKAGVEPVGIVINLREHHASWQTIADVYGISRQAAYDRWAKYSTV